MVVTEALKVVGQALELGAKNGSYGIADSSIINTAYSAISKFITENSEPEVEEKESK